MLTCISCVLKTGDLGTDLGHLAQCIIFLDYWHLLASLAELFTTHGGDVNPKLTKMVGQIIQSRMASWQEAAYRFAMFAVLCVLIVFIV